MKIILLAEISGVRDGKPWPAVGEVVDLPDDEARVLIDNGIAEADEAPTAPEAAVAPPAPEVAAERPAPEAATLPEGENR